MKKFLILLLIVLSTFTLSSCEMFEKVTDELPSGYTPLKYDDSSKFNLKGICKDKTVFAVYPGSQEQGSITDKVGVYKDEGYDITEDTDFKDPNKLVYVADIKDAIDGGKEVVVIIAPGISNKGLGSASNSTTEAKRALDICKLKEDSIYKDHLTIIQMNFADYSKDDKTETLVKSIASYIDCLVVYQKTVSSKIVASAIQSNIPIIEYTSSDLFPLFDYMFE